MTKAHLLIALVLLALLVSIIGAGFSDGRR